MKCMYLVLAFTSICAGCQGIVPAQEIVGQNQLEAPVRLKAGKGFIDTGEYSAHAGPRTVDLDANGIPDLLVGNFDGHFQVYINRGTRKDPNYEYQGLLKVDGESVTIPNW